jgi:C4-dicarboxylate-specific signal transduction histidine kinase
VNSLRLFARDGSSDQFLKVQASQILEDCLVICEERFKSNGIKLILDLAEPDLTLECRAVQISQVLINVLSNANDAIQNLTEKWIKITITRAGEEVQFAITDSGPRISPEIVAKIFNPFFTTKDVGKGTGLGLSISLGIVKDHGGRIWVDPDCANTRFIISLPLFH